MTNKHKRGKKMMTTRQSHPGAGLMSRTDLKQILDASIHTGLPLQLFATVHAGDLSSWPQLVTVTELKRLLAAASDAETRLFIVLCSLAGLRQREVEELCWEQITPGELIHVHAPGTRRSRILPIRSALDEWLQPFYGKTGLVITRPHLHMRVAQLARELGLKRCFGVLRRSYAAYRFAQGTNMEKLCGEMGVAVPATKHILSLVTADAARLYFALTPQAIGIADWPGMVADQYGAASGHTK